MWESLLQLFRVFAGPGQPGTRTTRRGPTKIAGKPVVARQPRGRSNTNGRVSAQPRRQPYWMARGWRRRGNRLVGAYRTTLRSVAGEIELNDKGRADFFMINPPPEVLSGSHGACFRARENGRFWVHFNRGNDVDGGILELELIIARALGAA
jgi:hypothetical protein